MNSVCAPPGFAQLPLRNYLAVLAAGECGRLDIRLHRQPASKAAAGFRGARVLIYYGGLRRVELESRVEMDAPGQARRGEGAESEQIALLSRQFRPALRRFFGKRVKEQHEIDDLVQDVFVRLVRKVQADGSQIVAGYVFQTAQSVLNDWLRKRQVRQSAAHEQIGIEAPDLEDGATPERDLVGKQSLASATAAVLELPEVTRTIFLLRRLEGMRYADIARRLHMPISTIEKHMARAVAHLDLRLNGKS